MKEKLYKNKYCIGVYETNDGNTLIGLFDTPKDLAEYLEVSVPRARTIISQRSGANKSRNKIFIGNKLVSICLVDMTD